MLVICDVLLAGVCKESHGTVVTAYIYCTPLWLSDKFTSQYKFNWLGVSLSSLKEVYYVQPGPVPYRWGYKDSDGTVVAAYI